MAWEILDEVIVLMIRIFTEDGLKVGHRMIG